MKKDTTTNHIGCLQRYKKHKLKVQIFLGFVLAHFFLITYPVARWVGFMDHEIYKAKIKGEETDHSKYNQLHVYLQTIEKRFKINNLSDLEIVLQQIPPKIFFLDRILDRRMQYLDAILENQGVPSNSRRLLLIDLEKYLPSASWKYPLGSTLSFRNLLGCLYEGYLVWFFPGLISLVLSLITGTILGVGTSFLDTKYLRAVFAFTNRLLLSVPKIMMMLVIAAIFNFNLYIIMAIIGLLNGPRLARLLSDKIEVLKQQQFIESARELQLNDTQILAKHILWYHCWHLFVFQIVLSLADAVFAETTLSYLRNSTFSMSWGRLINQGTEYINQGCHWLWVFPVLAMLITSGGYYIVANYILNSRDQSL